MPAKRPRVKNLGELAGDVLVFGGPCSNLQATRAVLDIAEQRGIPAERRICTGDAVAYCGDPVETLRTLQGHCELVAGNCEKQLIAGADDCACGFEDGSVCAQMSVTWFRFARKSLGTAELSCMADCPDMIVFSAYGLRYAVIHGGATDISRYLWPTSPQSDFASEVAAITDQVGSIDAVVAGHCGVAFERHVAGVRWINPGAIGMPPNDGRRQTRYMVLTERGARIERLDYDVDGAVAAMQSAGLVQGYDQALKTGIWPSQDILPMQMRR